MFIGIDIGTSATKCVLIDEAGEVLASASSGYAVEQPRAGWSQQRPGVWWQAACAAVRETLRVAAAGTAKGDAAEFGRAVRGIGLSGQMHGSCLLDAPSLEAARTESVDALRPALLWNDQRTSDECAEIEAAFGSRAAVVERVGNAPLTGFTLPKLMWVRKHEPRVWREVAGWCMPKDFVRLQMTGEMATDVGDAAGTLLLNVDERRWDGEFAERFGVERHTLPRLVESGSAAGELTAFAADALGLRAGVPVVAGSGDNQMGAIGAGVIEPGAVLATLGTSGVIYAHADRPKKDLAGESPGRVHTMCAADGTVDRCGGWAITGVTLSAAGSLAWFRDSCAPEATYEALLTEAESSPPGARGVVFLNSLTGERCPHPDPSARGAFVGLTSRHTRGDLVRALLEGVTFSMKQILDIVESTGVRIDRVRLGGGGNRSQLWRQMQADVYGRPVTSLTAEEGPAFGAALLAAVRGGAFPDLRTACARTLEEHETLEAGDAAGKYAEPLSLHQGLYERLAPTFGRLAAVDEAG